VPTDIGKSLAITRSLDIDLRQSLYYSLSSPPLARATNLAALSKQHQDHMARGKREQVLFGGTSWREDEPTTARDRRQNALRQEIRPILV
jgi:hypothetical protein